MCVNGAHAIGGQFSKLCRAPIFVMAASRRSAPPARRRPPTTNLSKDECFRDVSSAAAICAPLCNERPRQLDVGGRLRGHDDAYGNASLHGAKLAPCAFARTQKRRTFGVRRLGVVGLRGAYQTSKRIPVRISCSNRGSNLSLVSPAIELIVVDTDPPCQIPRYPISQCVRSVML
jgi:hypothetical protein